MIPRGPARSLVAACAVALGILTTACSKADEAAAEGGVQAVVGARTAVVTTQPFTETVSALGTVVARAGRSASLSAPVQTRVTHVYVTPGQRVTTGQTLVSLDATAFVAALQSANAAVAAAQQNVDRTQRLVREGVSPRKDAEAAAADLARVQSDRVAAQRTADLATIRSPITGVVTRVGAMLGATADPAQPLVEVVDPSALDILLNATPSDAARFKVGAKVALTAGSSANEESLGIGTVVDIAAIVDSATRSVAVRVHAPTTRRVLRVGETLTGNVTVATRANAVVVPLEALVPEGDGFRVFVVDSANIAHARDVKVGARTDKAVEITDGLTAGERVVTYGAYGVSDSAKVVPPSQAGQPAKPDTAEKP